MLYRQTLVPKKTEMPPPILNTSTIKRIKGNEFALMGRMAKTLDEYKQEILRYGGSVTEIISAKLDAVFVNRKSSTSSKYQEAVQLKIPILTEYDLIKLLNVEKQLAKEELRKQQASRNIRGKSFVITGTLSERRDLVIQKITSLGGTVNTKVARHTDYLIVGDKGTTTTKYKDALAYGIRTITEFELRNMLN